MATAGLSHHFIQMLYVDLPTETQTHLNQSKDVSLSINRTQVAKIDIDLQTRSSEGPNESSL